MLLLGGSETASGAFFSNLRRLICDKELRVSLPAPLEVRKGVVVELVEADPRAPSAALGESVAVTHLL